MVLLGEDAIDELVAEGIELLPPEDLLFEEEQRQRAAAELPLAPGRLD